MEYVETIPRFESGSFLFGLGHAFILLVLVAIVAVLAKCMVS